MSMTKDLGKLIPEMFENVFSYPQLDTVLMVEKFIEENSAKYKRKALWQNLPKKMKYQTFKVIIDYLQHSMKIAIDKEGKVVWIGYKFNEKLAKGGVEVQVKTLKARVIFHSDKLYNLYLGFEHGSNEEKKLYKWISRAINDLKRNAFSGAAVPKEQIPKKYYKEFEAKTIWKYDLPNGYRIIYTIENNEVEIFAVILEWMDHTKYNRIFKY